MTSELRRRAALLALPALLLGCFDEELPEEDLAGSLVVSADITDDIRSIGVVYIGIYEGWDPDQLGYSYPTTGPRVGDNPIGDALPYGGTSVGAYTYACFRALQCQAVTGRFATIEDLLEVHPIAEGETEDGEVDLVTVEEFYDQCQWYYGWNSIEEFSFIGHDQLDFRENADGDWEAPFTALHTRLPAGSILWAFADNDRTSCSASFGSTNRRQSEDGVFFREGSNFGDVLNFPDKYITAGDFLSETPTVVEDGKREGYVLRMDGVKD